ncbi:MAG: hypothetical protein ABGX16_00350, partial [Pirellulales bacterium]
MRKKSRGRRSGKASPAGNEPTGCRDVDSICRTDMRQIDVVVVPALLQRQHSSTGHCRQPTGTETPPRYHPNRCNRRSLIVAGKVFTHQVGTESGGCAHRRVLTSVQNSDVAALSIVALLLLIIKCRVHAFIALLLVSFCTAI